MKPIVKALLVAASLVLASSAAMAQSAKDAVSARQADMQLRKFNIGILAAMAQGKMEYDAKKASAAANNLKILATMNGGAMWAPGSGMDNAELATMTSAKPEIWSTYPAIAEKGKAYVEAVTAMAEVAGDGLDAVKANLGKLGASCGGCHKSFRAKR